MSEVTQVTLGKKKNPRSRENLHKGWNEEYIIKDK